MGSFGSFLGAFHPVFTFSLAWAALPLHNCCTMGVKWMGDPFAGYRQRLLHDLANAFADHDAARFCS